MFSALNSRRKAKLGQEYGSLRADLDRVTAIRANMGKYRAEYTRSREKLQEVLVQLPETKDVPNLLRSISGVSAESGAKVKYFEPKAVVNKEFYGEVPVDIKFSGSFHNIGYFFDGVRKLDRIIDITSFTLDAKGPASKTVLEGECQAKTYVYLHEAPAPKKDNKGAPVAKK